VIWRRRQAARIAGVEEAIAMEGGTMDGAPSLRKEEADAEIRSADQERCARYTDVLEP
jgi:hypothetical protein